MKSRTRTALALAWLALGWLVVAWAGMPSVTLSDLARMRFQTISFFLLVLLASAWAIRGIWNGLRSDIPRLPRLSYGKAVGPVSLWGLLFLLVLTMISGARELMTPGAWVKQGFTSRLADTPAPAHKVEPDPARLRKLEGLRSALWTFAWAHGGRFPTRDELDQLPVEVWRVPDPADIRYLYVEGRAPNRRAVLLAYEPGVFGPERLVLLSDGTIRSMSLEAIRRDVPGEDH